MKSRKGAAAAGRSIFPSTKSTDIYTPEKRSLIMSSVKTKGTKPELAVRSILWQMGIRYRLNRTDLPGKPDIVIMKRRLVIFVHGCFWHGHDCAKGLNRPKQNKDFWEQKIARNRERDTARIGSLQSIGWSCVEIWECQTRNNEHLRDRLSAELSA